MPIQKSPIVINDEILFSEDKFSIIAGPCAVEDEQSLLLTAGFLSLKGIRMIRGGVRKLRTSPHSFQGMGEEGASLLSSVAQSHGLYSVSEITSIRELDLFTKYIDIIVVGTRNMHNTDLLLELGKIDKPIILKRGMSATVKEWLNAAEYIKLNGNDRIILCERGIRTFETAMRNTFDIASAVYMAMNYDYLVITDPSHATGINELVVPMTLASLAAGVHGAMIEIHPDPETALSDSEQMLSFPEFSELHTRLYSMKI
jgi:3-deoxy-7-phosphoheptulonate synthase